MNRKFKKGDRVRIKGRWASEAGLVGTEGIIEALNKWGRWYIIVDSEGRLITVVSARELDLIK